MKAVCIAGTASGVGKTTLAAGLMGLFLKKGYSVAPFKVGPDYIDPQFHTFITGSPCSNLDSFFLDQHSLEYIFQRNGCKKDISIVEGVMGLYDGLGVSEKGSTASTAKKLNIPVVLVLDGKASSRSIAPIIRGFCDFDKEVNIVGVIFNRVSGERHYLLLKEIVETYCDVSCLGYMPAKKELVLKSRHLGLIPAGEVENLETQLEQVVLTLEKTIDFPGLLKAAGLYKKQEKSTNPFSITKKEKPINLAIARDDAFTFYYHDNLQLLKEAGINLVPFSPLNDKKLPAGTDAIYIGGGFPEEFAEELSSNREMTGDIKEQLEAGMPAFGECGGLMYLTEGIVTQKGHFFPMTGFFNVRCEMTKKLQRFGYARVEYDGIQIKAHEFHHSKLIEKKDGDYRKTFRVTRERTGETWECGLAKKNVLAGYAHLHFYANLHFFENIINLLQGNRLNPKYT